MQIHWALHLGYMHIYVYSFSYVSILLDKLKKWERVKNHIYVYYIKPPYFLWEQVSFLKLYLTVSHRNQLKLFAKPTFSICYMTHLWKWMLLKQTRIVYTRFSTSAQYQLLCNGDLQILFAAQPFQMLFLTHGFKNN